MEKKKYAKPIMNVVELKRRVPILLQSPTDDPPYPGGYIPGMGSNELNKLA